MPIITIHLIFIRYTDINPLSMQNQMRSQGWITPSCLPSVDLDGESLRGSAWRCDNHEPPRHASGQLSWRVNFITTLEQRELYMVIWEISGWVWGSSPRHVILVYTQFDCFMDEVWWSKGELRHSVIHYVTASGDHLGWDKYIAQFKSKSTSLNRHLAWCQCQVTIFHRHLLVHRELSKGQRSSIAPLLAALITSM